MPQKCKECDSLNVAFKLSAAGKVTQFCKDCGFGGDVVKIIGQGPIDIEEIPLISEPDVSFHSAGIDK